MARVGTDHAAECRDTYRPDDARHPIAIPFRFCRGAVDYQDRSPEETLLHGWMLHPEIEFEAALLAVDGRVAGEEPLFHRADIDFVFPSFAGRKTGFRFDHLNLETRGHELSVIGVDAAGRMAALTVCPADGRGDAARSSATPDAACGGGRSMLPPIAVRKGASPRISREPYGPAMFRRPPGFSTGNGAGPSHGHAR